MVNLGFDSREPNAQDLGSQAQCSTWSTFTGYRKDSCPDWDLKLIFSFRTCMGIRRCWRTALWWWQVWYLHHCLWDSECHTHWSGTNGRIQSLRDSQEITSVAELPWVEERRRVLFILFYFWDGVSLCCPGWNTVAWYWLTATSASRVQVFLLPQPPK